MATPIVYRDEVFDDLVLVYGWYEEKEPELGESFLKDFADTIRRIQDFPEMLSVVRENVRRAQLRRFPYGVFYVAEPAQVTLYGVMDLRRDPRRWIDRTRKR